MSLREPSILNVLIRHFFVSFFRLSFLDDAGEQSFKRGIIGVVSVIAGLGFLLVRLYMGRYAALRDVNTLVMTIRADRLFIITLPMFGTAAAMALVVHRVFPDELDFWSLMPLPMSRRTVFTAKFVALFLFTSIFTLGTNLFLALPLSAIVNGRDPGQSALLANACQWLTGTWASVLVVIGVVSVEGLLIAVLPRTLFRAAAIWLQTGMIAALVLAVPFMFRIPGLGPVLQRSPRWLLTIPPAWFFGVEHWLLGERDAYTDRLALLAIGATIALAMVAVSTSLAVYRRFDQSAFRPGIGHAPAQWNLAIHWPAGRYPAREAVRDFMGATLRRSGLHQLVSYGLFAIGLAMATNSLLGSAALSDRWMQRAVLGMPFTLMAGAVVGVRTALLLPTNPRAAWIFRFTEQAATRGHQLDAVSRGLFVSGVVLPTAFAVPVQAAWFGVAAITALVPLTLAIGWTLTELALLEWRRIPFTCTILFAKRPAAFTFLMLVMIFGWFVFVSTSLLVAARASVTAWSVVALLVSVVGLTLRAYRRHNWGRWPLEFEDYLPDGLDTLRLGD